MHLSRLRPLLLVACIAAAGCTSLPDTREVAVHGVVMAPDRPTAVATVRLWDEIAPRLVDLDAGLEVRPVEVWLFDRLDDEDVYGGYDERNRRVLLDAVRQHPDITLAHELVHAYEPADWDRLPAVVREGLADWLASRAVPGTAAEMHASRAISLASYATGGLPTPLVDGDEVRIVRMGVAVDTDLTPTEALAIRHGRIREAGDGATLKALYGMGLLIVTRAGEARLTALSREAATRGDPLVSPERILAAARLDADPTTWLAAIEGLVAEPEQQAAVRRILGPATQPQDERAAIPDVVRD